MGFKKYDPDQPRDENGRWAPGAGDKTPVSGIDHGSIISLKEGDSFSATQSPFLAKEGGWHELNALESVNGQFDSTLKPGGRVLTDQELVSRANNVSMVYSNVDQITVKTLAALDAMPVGATVETALGSKSTKTPTGWTGADGQSNDVKYMTQIVRQGARRVK